MNRPLLSPLPSPVERSLAACRSVLWKRFVDRHGVLLDFADDAGGVDLPTPEDCRVGRPNAIGWYSPIENGAFFNGLHLYGLCLEPSPENETLLRMERLAEGLVSLTTCSDVPGFIGRGLGSDGKCHYPMGSDDQTHPWFLGLGIYLLSGRCTGATKARIEEVFLSTAKALDEADWKLPCDGAFTGQHRGDLGRFEFRPAAQWLFILKLLHRVTGDAFWEKKYLAAREVPAAPGTPSRRKICSRGCMFDFDAIPDIKQQMWIVAGAQASLFHLQEWDPEARNDYRAGMKVNGEIAEAELPSALRFDPVDETPFRLHDWRGGFPLWRRQETQADAQRFALEQLEILDGKDAPRPSRRILERYFVQQPLASAAVFALQLKAEGRSPDGLGIEVVLTRYEYARMQTSGFLFGDLAGCILKSI